MTAQQTQVASATPLFYQIHIPYQAILNAKFDPADVTLSVVKAPSNFRSESLEARSTFSADDEKATLLFLKTCVTLECEKEACWLVRENTPIERIRTLLEKNVEAKGFRWVDRELERLSAEREGRFDSSEQGMKR